MTATINPQRRRPRTLRDGEGAPVNTDKIAGPRMDWGMLEGGARESIRRIRTIAQPRGETAACAPHSSVTAPALEIAGAPPISASAQFPRQGALS